MSGYLHVPRRKKFITEEEAATIIQEQLGGLDLSDLGKGISSLTIYYLNTKRSSGVTIDMELDDRDNGVIWTVNFVAPGALYPYTWKYTHIVYSDNTTFDSACELAAQYNSGGVSIVDIRTWYLNTSLSSVTRPNNEEERIAAGWVSTFTSPTSDARYTWKYTEHVYSDGNSVYSDIELVAIFVRDGMGTQDAYAVWGEEAPIITVKNQNLPISQDGPTWYYNFDSLTIGENQYLWMSERVHNGVTFEEWCDPIRISGNQGKAGEDAEDIEFIYKRSDRTPTTNDTPTIPPTLSPENDYVPDYLDRQTRFGDTFDDAYKVERNLGWKDNPQGVGWADTDEDGVDDTFFKYEWMSQRVKPRTSDPDNTNWETWTKPVVWSVYGDKGMDGDGVEYIFKLTVKTVTSLQRPSSAEGDGEINDQGEWIPYTDPAVLDVTEKAWTDNPTGTSPAWQKEWVSIRKKINDTWGPFSIPTIWNNYCDIYIGEDGHWIVNGEWTEHVAEGQDGTGIIIRGSVETYLDKQNGQSSLQAVDTSQCEIGDCYVVEENQHLHVFNGTIDPEDWTRSWSDLGEFRGEPGISSYIHLAWANGITFTSTGELEGIVEFSTVKGTKDWEWMGICVTDSTMPDAATDPGRDRWKEYKWNHIKGKDGTNFEKVFLLTNEDIAPTIEYTPYDGKTKDDDKYLPGYSFSDGEAHTPSNMTRFTDNPSNVRPEFPFQWVAERERKEDPTDGVVKWFNFNAPTLWSTYSKDGNPGQASYKANVFKRSVDAPELPEPAANNFEHPLPEGWFDSFPATGTGPVWMITRIFTNDEQPPQQATWVGPILMKDDEGNFDVEFSDNPIDSRPPIPVKSGPGANCHNSGDNQIWYDPDDDEDYLSNPAHKMNWMATRTRIINQEGVPDWGNWAITLIRGEQGSPGSGVEYAYAVFDSDTDTSLIVISNRYADTPTTELGSNNIVTWSFSLSDLQYGPDKYIWMTQRTYSNGEYGLWDSPPIRLSGNEGRPGEDAEDIEFVYLQSNDLPGPTESPGTSDYTYEEGGVIKTKTYDDDDYAPAPWTDNPQGVSSEHKYEWMCQRTKPRTNDISDPAHPWGPWSKVVVWSAYGDTGMDGDGIEYVFYRGSEPPKPQDPVLNYVVGGTTHTIEWNGDVYDSSTNHDGSSWAPKDFTLGRFTGWDTNRGSYNTQGEWIPKGGWKNGSWILTDWKDNPLGVEYNNPEEWVSIRKKTQGTWKEFSSPTLWSNYSILPDIHIGDDGYWYIGDVKTDHLAEGPQGQGIQLKDTVDYYSNAEKQAYIQEQAQQGNTLTPEQQNAITTLENIDRQTVPDIDVGDCYVIKYGVNARFLYVCATEKTQTWKTGNNWEDNWDEVGEFQGEPGLNSYVHIAWAASNDTDPVRIDGQDYYVQGKNINFDSSGNITLIKKFLTQYEHKNPNIEYDWMGICADNRVLDPESDYDLKTDNESITSAAGNWSSYKWNSVRGRDGDNYERVYIRTKSEVDEVDFPRVDPNDPTSDYIFEAYEESPSVFHYYQDSEYLPVVKDYTIGGNYSAPRFTDDPVGVDDEFKAEWMAERRKKKDPTDGVVKWFPFSKPSLWATYSSSQPWIKASTSTIQVHVNSAGKLSNNFTITFKTQLYKGNEGPLMPVLENCSATYSYYNATITRGSVGSDNEITWTFNIPSSSNVLSEEHNIDVTMSNGGQVTATGHILVSITKDSQSSYKSTMFVRMNDTPRSPGDAGSFTNPSPSNCYAGMDSDNRQVYWSDGIPGGTNTLWATTRRFTSDEVDQDSSWSTPREMTDTEYYDVEFAKKYINDGTPPDPIKEGENANCYGSGDNQIWYDPDDDSSEDFSQMYWRAERECRNGEWGNWVKLRIKGETGNSGFSAQLSKNSGHIDIDSEGNYVGVDSLADKYYTDVIIWQDLGEGDGRQLEYQTLDETGEVLEDGKYTISSYSTNNCEVNIVPDTASNYKGRIQLTNILHKTDFSESSVDITITTYTGAEFHFTYTLYITHLDRPYLTYNLTNEFDDITYRTGSKKYFGIPIETYIEAYAGNTKIDGTNINEGYFLSTTVSGALVGSSPVKVNSTLNGTRLTYGETTVTITTKVGNVTTDTGLRLYIKSNGYVKLFRNTDSTADYDLPDSKHNLDISCEVKYAGVTYKSPSKRFTIKEITDSTLYDLFVPNTSISDDHGVYNPTEANFKVQAIITDEAGSQRYNPSTVAETYGQIFGNIYIKYIKSAYDPTKTYYTNANSDTSQGKIYTLYPLSNLSFASLPNKIFSVVLVDLSNNNIDFLDVQSVTINSCGEDGEGTVWMNLNRNKIVIDCEDDGTIIYTRTVPITASLMWGSVPCVLNTANCDINISVDEGGSDVESTNASFSPTTNPTVLSKTFTFTRGNTLGSGEITVALKGTADSKTYTKSEVITVESSRQGPEGIGGFKSIVFRRTNTELTSSDTPEGGDYDSPYPTSPANTWFDGIPEGEEKIWASSCTFYNNSTDTGWSTPRSMSDTDYYDVEFAGVYNNNTLADTTPPDPVKWENASITKPCNSWRPSTADSNLVVSQIWFDPNKDKYVSGTTLRDFTKMYWRAERECRNGEWGDWTKTRIKGEGETWIWTSVSSIVVNTNSAGKLATGFSKNFTAKLYHGDAFLVPKQSSSSVSYGVGSIQISTINSNTGSVGISMSMDQGAQPPVSGNITITLDNGTYSSTTTIPVIVNKIAQSSFKSTMFVRMDGTPSSPGDAGSFANPSPTGCTAGLNSNGSSVDWTDGIPAGSDSIWATSRRFTSDGVNQDDSWSDPTKMVDNKYYDVEFARKYDNGSLIDTTPPDPVKEGENANCNGSANQIWYDPVDDSSEDFTNMYWRAEREYKNGSWGTWTKLRIKGESGSQGDQGRGVSSISTWYKAFNTLNVSMPSTNYSESQLSNTYGWSKDTYVKPTKTEPYLWKFTRIVYTLPPSPEHKNLEMVQVWSENLINPNLLDNTEFYPGLMDKWASAWDADQSPFTSTSSSSGPDSYGLNYSNSITKPEGHNYYGGSYWIKSDYTNQTGYIVVLKQYLYNKNTGFNITKINAGNWYTVSFWMRGSSYYTETAPSFKILSRNSNGSDISSTGAVDLSAGIELNGYSSSSYAFSFSWEDNNTSYNTFGNNWREYTVTFKIKSTIPSTVKSVHIEWLLNTKSKDLYNIPDHAGGAISISMPKLEIGKIATGYVSSNIPDPFPRTSAWDSGKQYFQGQYGEPYMDIVSYGSNWFRCRTTHISSSKESGEDGANRPEIGQTTAYWEPSENLSFVATDLILAKTATIDNLIAGSLRTGYCPHPHVEMFGSQIHFYGTQTHPNIIMATDDTGMAYLKFYDSEGTFLYDLGPSGIVWSPAIVEVETKGPYFTNINETYIEASLGTSGIPTLSDFNTVGTKSNADSDIWKFTAKTRNGVITGDDQYTNNDDSIAKQANGKFFTSSTNFLTTVNEKTVIDENKYVSGIYRKVGEPIDTYTTNLGTYNPSRPLDINDRIQDWKDGLVLFYGFPSGSVNELNVNYTINNNICTITNPVRIRKYVNFYKGSYNDATIFNQGSNLWMVNTPGLLY